MRRLVFVGVLLVCRPAWGVLVGDAKIVTDCVTTAGNTTVTSATAPWLVGDTTKKMWINNGQSHTDNDAMTYVAAGSITLAAAPAYSGTGTCVWATQDDTTALKALFNTANAQTPVVFPCCSGGGNTVTVPCGGYVVTGPIYISTASATPDWKGGGATCTALFPVASMALAGAGHGDIFEIAGQGPEITGATIYGIRFNYGMVTTEALMYFGAGSNAHFHDFQIGPVGATGSGSAVYLSNTQHVHFDNIYIQNSSAIPNSLMSAMYLSGSSSGTFTNVTLSNFYTEVIADGNGDATQIGATVFNGGLLDENAPGSANSNTMLINGARVTFVGTTIWSNPQYGINVDGTSNATLLGARVGPYLSNASKSIYVASGGIVTSTGSLLWGGSSAWITNTGNFYMGIGNVFQACPSGPPCTTKPWRTAFSSPNTVLRN